MNLLRLVFRNIFRHSLRSFLTILGIGVTITAFGLLRTLVSAWNTGVEASSDNRLITRNAVSFIFPLPLTYRNRIATINGVELVTYANWFQGVYIDENQFFPRLAVDAETFLESYPEYLLTTEELETFKKERNSCIIGSIIAERYNLQSGDIMQVEGNIYPGIYEFVVRGIYQPRDGTTDATQMFFHWDYLNERLVQDAPTRANEVGWYIVTIAVPSQSASVSESIDGLFQNSSAETKTETEASFQQSFISMSGAIIQAINVISIIIIGIIGLVLSNTMAMTARERNQEYAVLKTLGFKSSFITRLIASETLLISLLGGIFGLAITFLLADSVQQFIPAGWFPVFEITATTIGLSALAVVAVAIFASLYPVWYAKTQSIVEGLRQIS